MVVGLDLVRAWKMVVDPINLRLYMPKDPGTIWEVPGMEIEGYPDAFGECRYWRHTPMQGERGMGKSSICAEELYDDTPRHLLSGTVNAQFRIKGCGSFVPYMDDKYVVMAEETGNVQLFTVMASSEEEGKAMQDFFSSCPVDLQQLIQRSPQIICTSRQETTSAWCTALYSCAI